MDENTNTSDRVERDPLCRISQIVGPGRPRPFLRSHLCALVAGGQIPKPNILNAPFSAGRESKIRAYIETSEKANG